MQKSRRLFLRIAALLMTALIMLLVSGCEDIVFASKCSWPGCENMTDYDYCGAHRCNACKEYPKMMDSQTCARCAGKTCEYEGCTIPLAYSTDYYYCYTHRCVLCSEPRDGDTIYCTAHQDAVYCNADGCTNKRKSCGSILMYDSYPYCREHSCVCTGCPKLAVIDGCCEEHRWPPVCRYAGCENPVTTLGREEARTVYIPHYCADHKCLIDGCNNPRAEAGTTFNQLQHGFMSNFMVSYAPAPCDTNYCLMHQDRDNDGKPN